MDNLEIDYKKAAQQLRSVEAMFGKHYCPRKIFNASKSNNLIATHQN